MFTIDTKGLDTAYAKLLFCEQYAKIAMAVELSAKERADGKGITNADVLEFLAEGNPNDRRGPQKRDMITPTKEVIAEMEAAIVKEIERRIEEFGGRDRWVTHKEILAGKGTRPPRTSTVKNRAREAMAASLKAAAIIWEQFITDNIENQTWQGGGSTSLSDEYKAEKQKKHGFAYPIGKATGQLLDNVAPNTKGFRIITGRR